MKKHVVAAGLAAGLIAGAGVAFALESGDDDHGARNTPIAIGANNENGSGMGPGMGGGMGPGMGGGQGSGPGEGGPGGQMRGPNLQVVADELGLTVDEVRSAIEAGTTLAELAEQEGKEAQDLIDALVAEAQNRIAAKVTAGDLTQDEADARLEEATERITDFVNNTPAAGPGGPNSQNG